MNKAHEEVGKVIFQLQGACEENINTRNSVNLAIKRCNEIQDKQLSELHSWLHALDGNKTR